MIPLPERPTDEQTPDEQTPHEQTPHEQTPDVTETTILVPPNNDGIVVDWDYLHATEPMREPKCFCYFSIQEAMMYAAIFEIAALMLKSGFDYFLDRILRDSQLPPYKWPVTLLIHGTLMTIMYFALVLESIVCSIVTCIIIAFVIFFDFYNVVRLLGSQKLSSTRVCYSTGAYLFLGCARIIIVIVVLRYILFLFNDQLHRKANKENLENITASRTSSIQRSIDVPLCE